MLDTKTIKEIEDFIYIKPRSIQEIASHIKKNWRTADRYIEHIKEEHGTIETRIFREGTRGALKIVYWASVEKISHSIFQEELERQILTLHKKEDFSAFNIFQYVKENNKSITVEKEKSENDTNLKELNELLKQTKKELLLFSGNLSWINLKNNKIDFLKLIEDLAKKNVPIKVLCRVDLEGIENIKRMLSINKKIGKENIEIHHSEQPLRAIISDNRIIRIKEIKEPTGKINELDKRVFIFYAIWEKEWVEWSIKIFRKIFYNSLGAEKRLEQISKYFKNY
jgi:hypothetical protein